MDTKTLAERKAKYVERRDSLVNRVKSLREIGGEGNMYMADVLEDSRFKLDQAIYEINLLLA